MNTVVSKSSVSILAIGATGLILLSLMMQHLGEVASQRGSSPYAAMVQSKLRGKLVGGVRIADRTDGQVRRLRVRATVLAGLPKRELAQVAGREVWLGALRASDAPDEVIVVLTDDAGDETLECRVASPVRPLPAAAAAAPAEPVTTTEPPVPSQRPATDKVPAARDR